MAQTENNEAEYCTFYLDDLFLGTPIGRVKEVLDEKTVADVPLSDQQVEGLINLRGRIITSLNLRKRLSLGNENDDVMNVIVEFGDETFSLRVDEIGEVLTVDEQTREPPPQNLDKVSRNFISHVHRLDSSLLLVIDLETLLNF